MTFLTALGLIAAAAVSTPLIVLGAECLLACLPARRRGAGGEKPRPSIAVLVPAHNEEANLAPTLEAIRPQLADGDRLIVVADNCEDRTAAVAEELGAKVLVRDEPDRRGKGYAILYALEHVRAEPPGVVVSIDADCVAAPGSIDAIVRRADAHGKPVQAAYVMDSPADAESVGMSRVSEFAVLVKNYVRPRGLEAIGLPCLLTGSGMAFPWEALERTPHPDSHIVEDMTYAVDLALNCYAPQPCMGAKFVARLPAKDSAFTTQRTRWEHGHLATIRSQAPRLLGGFLKSGRLPLLAMLLELAVPPLSLVVAAAIAFALVAGGFAALGFSAAPLIIVLSATAFAGLGLFAAWLRFGREVLPWRVALSIPGYVLSKMPLYRRFLVAPEAAWVRTERDTAPANPGAPAPHFKPEGSPASQPAHSESS